MEPLAGLVRLDNFGYPVVIPKGSIFVTAGTDRRSSGTHYTPRSLTEPIVQYTLEPLVYVGPAEGKPKADWKLKSAKELLDLKICDMACGSGAFLVQAARYMAERLMEAWDTVKQANLNTPGITPKGTPSSGKANETLIPDDPAERKIYAMRIIAQRCLYGVDKNPLAAEMAKLSLWLLTLAKDKPFEFLDHCIRCGDSLVGLHDLEQVRHFSLKPDADDAVLFGGPFEEAVNEAISLRLKLADMPANTVEDVERQDKLLTEANETIARLRNAADLLLAAHFWGGTAKDKLERIRHAAVVSGHYVEKGPTEEFEKKATEERRGQSMFHWPLEFPEVIVKRGGFDAFVCNPPFQGGSRLVEQAGDAYATFLAESRDKLTKKTDLCCHFFRRSHELLNDGGALGMIATNSVTQGASRKGSLDVLLADGRPICFALSSFSWPGAASLSVAVILFGPKRYRFKPLLDWQYVESIDGLLDVSLGQPPVRLIENDGTCYLGVHLGGTPHFVVTQEQAEEWIASNSRNSEVLFPFVGGDEIGQTPLNNTARWIISFGERGFEEVERYFLPLQHLVEFVKPERAKKNEKKYPRLVNQWWKFWHSRNELYHDIHSLQRVIVRTRTTGNQGVQQVRFCPSNWVHTDGVIVFKLQNWSDLAVLQSSFHGIWAQRYSSSHNTGPRYIPTDCFGTFPRPAVTPDSCQVEVKAFDELRTRLMGVRQNGVTGISNLLHDESKMDADVVGLRQLFTSLDEAVRNAYGWDDIRLAHGFHDTRYGRHFTISNSARVVILTRLVELNRDRARGQEAMSASSGSLVRRDAKRTSTTRPMDDEATLFDMEDDE